MIAPTTRPTSSSHQRASDRACVAAEIDLRLGFEIRGGTRGGSSGADSSRGPFPLSASAFLEPDARLPAEVGADPRRVRLRPALVAGHLGLARAASSAAAGEPLEQRDRRPASTPPARRRRCTSRCRAPSPRSSRRRRRRRTSSPALGAVAVERERPPSASAKAMRVNAMSGRCRGPKALKYRSTTTSRPKLARVRAREVLGRELRDPVRRERPRRRVLGRRIPLGLAVDRRRRREDDAHPVARGGLEDAPARLDVRRR